MYSLVVCGGTFDHFHKGHELFLSFAFTKGERVIIGLTTKKYVEKFKKEKYKNNDSYIVRKKNIDTFLKKKMLSHRAEVIPIDSFLGPTLSPQIPFQAIIVSEDSYTGGKHINEERKKHHLSTLPLEVFPLIKDERGKVISSSRIRKGEIDRHGNIYIPSHWPVKSLSLSKKLRIVCQKPFGKIKETFYSKDNNHFIMTVGDITSGNANKKKLAQSISVVDFKVKRKKIFKSLKDIGFSGKEIVLPVANIAGELSPESFSVVQKATALCSQNKQVIILVEGEEDLLVLPLILAAPLKSYIYYGQPNVGMVEIYVTEEKKQRAKTIIDAFQSSY